MAGQPDSNRPRRGKFSASAAEYEIIRAAAEKAGLSISTYVLEAALDRRPCASTERLMEWTALVEQVLARLHEIADAAEDDAQGLLIHRSLVGIERMVALLASDVVGRKA